MLEQQNDKEIQMKTYLSTNGINESPNLPIGKIPVVLLQIVFETADIRSGTEHFPALNSFKTLDITSVRK